MYSIVLVAGARPNFMKIAPILRAIRKCPDILRPVLVHTGQHYDESMSKSFLNSLGIGSPNHNLEVGSGSHAQQTAQIMIRFEEVCTGENPDMVLVVGDVNSTIAAGLVAKKLHIPLAHVEAGLRSRDREMPEEINRLATDAITDLFFTTEHEGTENLIREGHDPRNVHFVGHVMIDNLFHQLRSLRPEKISDSVKELRNKIKGAYACLTLHRPSNVDDEPTLRRLLDGVAELARDVAVVMPCHPRTLGQIRKFDMEGYFSTPDNIDAEIATGIIRTDPLGYDDFLYLWKDAQMVLTDSGGLQEETTALRVPCITLRENTERPVTVQTGSNELAGTDRDKIVALGRRALRREWKDSVVPDLWDGKASERIVERIIDYLSR